MQRCLRHYPANGQATTWRGMAGGHGEDMPTRSACLLFSLWKQLLQHRGKGCRTALIPLAPSGRSSAFLGISFVPKSTHSCEHLSTQWFGLGMGFAKRTAWWIFAFMFNWGLPYPEQLKAVPYVVTLGSGSWNLPAFKTDDPLTRRFTYLFLQP